MIENVATPYLPKTAVKLTHHFDLNVIAGYIEIKFKMNPSNYPAGIL